MVKGQLYRYSSVPIYNIEIVTISDSPSTETMCAPPFPAPSWLISSALNLTDANSFEKNLTVWNSFTTMVRSTPGVICLGTPGLSYSSESRRKSCTNLITTHKSRSQTSEASLFALLNTLRLSSVLLELCISFALIECFGRLFLNVISTPIIFH